MNTREALPSSPSVTLGESIAAVGAGSSSVMVSVTADGSRISRSLAAEPDTVTLLVGWSVALSTAVIVTVPVLEVAPAAIRSSVFELSRKSEAAVFVPAAADTVTTVSRPVTRSSAAVTVLPSRPPSAMESGDSESVTVAASSSSVIVPEADAVEIVAFTGSLSSRTTVSFVSSVSSPVTETVTVLLVSPAAKVSVPAESAA